MVLMGAEKGQLMNIAIELAKINHTSQMGVDCDYLMRQLNIATEFKKKAEKWLDDEFSPKKELVVDNSLNKSVVVPCVCAVCDMEISEKVRDYSINCFGKTLCFKCQKNGSGQEPKHENEE